jgi:hypothetical protein
VKKRTIIIAGVVAGIGIAVFAAYHRTLYRDYVMRPAVTRLMCDTAALKGASPFADAEATLATAERIDKLIGTDIAVEERVPLLKDAVCDASETPLYRALALDAHTETQAILMALNAEDTREVPWQNLVTKSRGTAIVRRVAKKDVWHCRELQHSSNPFGIEDEISVEEIYCKQIRGWIQMTDSGWSVLSPER